VPDATYHVYRAEPRRRRRWPYIVIAAVCVLAAVIGWQLYGVPRVSAVTPGPNAFVKTPSTTLVLDVKGLPKLQSVTVTLDGKDVTADAKRDGNTLTLTTGSLADGEHAVAFSAESSNLFRHNVREDWRFTVDTSVPTLKLDGAADEGRINTDPATFSGKTEPYATVTVVSGTIKASGTADSAGRYAVSVKLPDGASDVAITTADRAGNATTKKLHVFVDALPPVLKVTQLDKTMKKAGISVRVKATDQLGVPTVKFVLDGETRELTGPASKSKFKAANLAQGKHVMVVTAADKGGNLVTRRQVFTVDSTEHFGSATMWPGARGKDVRELQSKLVNAGVYSGKKTGFYDGDTEAAVRKLQAKYGLEVDGIVGGNVLNALSGQIVVDIGDLRLYLYRDGSLIKSYPVATGQPAYPTPTGTYSIVNMQKDPTWLPPNSDWAKEAKPIPPGTENPLGTRWMGTSAPGVGIHGVPPSEDGSIGTYASHGCIRMHNWDAVDLFDRVVIGMPVILRP
jgi:lipoprotein-anchoring transpeptidase ErfK/SrfK